MPPPSLSFGFMAAIGGIKPADGFTAGYRWPFGREKRDIGSHE